MSFISKISIRNMRSRKGRTICVFLSIFMSMLLFTISFLLYSSFRASYSDYLREGRSWDGDAGIYVYSEDDAKAIEESDLVKQTNVGYHIGAILIDEDYVQTEVVYYTEGMCKWMHCVPTSGRMPEKENEIVVSSDFLEARGLSAGDYQGKSISVDYTIAGENVHGDFTVVGFYDSADAVKDLILVSEKYYAGCMDKYLTGADRTDFPILVEVQYAMDHDFEALTQKLIGQTSLSPDNAEYMVNSEVEETSGTGIKAAALMIAAVILLLGILLTLNTYNVSLNNDIPLYRQLYTLGVNKKELIYYTYIQIQILAVIALLAGWICGILITDTLLVPMISHMVTIRVSTQITPALFVVTAVSDELMTVLCVLMVYRKTRRYIGINAPSKALHYKKKSGLKIRNLIWRMTYRRIGANKGSFVFVTLMLLVGVLLCNGISSYISGFNAEKYISGSMLVDYAVHSATFTSVEEKRKGFEKTQISGVEGLSGLEDSGGASAAEINVPLDDAAQQKYEQLGETSDNEQGNMHTYLYGLDDIFLKKMEVLQGKIDADKFESGDYCVIDSLGLEDTGTSCWNVGDTISLNNVSGKEKEYTVMAIVSFPYDLSYQSKWEGSSDIFVSEPEWEDIIGKSDYYLYAFNVDDEYKGIWDDTLGQLVKADDSLVYESAKTKLDENQNYFYQLRMLMIVMTAVSMIVILGGLLNIIFSEMNSLKKESINLQRIGVTRKELMTTFCTETGAYMFIGIVLGVLISPVIVRMVIDGVIAEDYVSYKSTGLIDALYLIFGTVVVIVTGIIYHSNFLKRRYIHE